MISYCPFLRKTFFSILLVGIFSLGFGSVLLAADVTVQETINLQLTIGGTVRTFQLESSNLTNFSLTDTLIHISTPAGERAVLSSGSLDVSFGAATDCSTPGKTRYVVEQSTNVDITPLFPATDSAEWKNNTCNGRVSTGGGGGSGSTTSSSSSSTSTPTPPPTPTTPTTPQTSVPPQPEEEPSGVISFKDVPASDKYIIPFVTLMVEKGTLKRPKPKSKYGTTAVLKGDFAVQIAAALTDVGCGGDAFVSIKKCRDALTAASVIGGSFTKGKVTRAIFYELLLRARGFTDFGTANKATLAKTCSDEKKGTNELAQVFFTAKGAKIAKVYKGKKCQLGKPMTRKEAAEFASKALKANPPAPVTNPGTPEPPAPQQ